MASDEVMASNLNIRTTDDENVLHIYRTQGGQWSGQLIYLGIAIAGCCGCDDSNDVLETMQEAGNDIQHVEIHDDPEFNPAILTTAHEFEPSEIPNHGAPIIKSRFVKPAAYLDFPGTTSNRTDDEILQLGSQMFGRDNIPRTAPDLLIEAADIIGQRATLRDQPTGERSMAKTIAIFAALTGIQLTEAQGWKFMVCLKLARSEGGRHSIDDYIDGAAYMALTAESLGLK